MSSKKLLELIPNTKYESKIKIDNNEILITGGAGFLGVHLLKTLVLSKKYNKIYTIVRSIDKIKIQADYFKLGKDWLKYVHIIEGDLLTLNESQFPNVETIIHCAAKIHCLKTLNQLWNDNVISTLKISQIYKNNSIFFISSLSVFVSSNLIGKHEPTSLIESEDYLLYGGYAQSKFLAEKIIEFYNQKIIRLGLITGSSNKGIFPDDFFKTFLKINKDLKYYPKVYEESFIDMTPVDYCSEIILNNLQNNLKIIHIANKTPTRLTDFINLLNLTQIDKEQWINLINKKSKLESLLLKFAFFKTETLNDNFCYFNLDLFQTTNHTYNIKNSFYIHNKNLLKLYFSKI